MIQPDLFNTGGGQAPAPQGDIPAQCRREARAAATKHSGLALLVERTFENHAAGTTADHVADLHHLVLNTVRRCVHDLAKSGTLVPIGVGMSRHYNHQTIYAHRNYCKLHAEAIKSYQEAKEQTAQAKERAARARAWKNGQLDTLGAQGAGQ